MRSKTILKRLWIIVCAALLWSLKPAAAFAQCAMCRVSAQGAQGTNPAATETLNLAILVLLIPPVLIFCAIFFVAYRYGKQSTERAETNFLRERQIF